MTESHFVPLQFVIRSESKSSAKKGDFEGSRGEEAQLLFVESDFQFGKGKSATPSLVLSILGSSSGALRREIHVSSTLKS